MCLRISAASTSLRTRSPPLAARLDLPRPTNEAAHPSSRRTHRGREPAATRRRDHRCGPWFCRSTPSRARPSRTSRRPYGWPPPGSRVLLAAAEARSGAKAVELRRMMFAPSCAVQPHLVFENAGADFSDDGHARHWPGRTIGIVSAASTRRRLRAGRDRRPQPARAYCFSRSAYSASIRNRRMLRRRVSASSRTYTARVTLASRWPRRNAIGRELAVAHTRGADDRASMSLATDMGITRPR